jgi:hypothetical protein
LTAPANRTFEMWSHDNGLFPGKLLDDSHNHQQCVQLVERYMETWEDLPLERLDSRVALGVAYAAICFQDMATLSDSGLEKVTEAIEILEG